MRTDISVRDVMTRAYLGVSESDPIVDVAQLMLDEDASVIAVIRGSELRGMVNERQLVGALLDDRRELDAPIESCMTVRPPTIAPGAGLAEAATILADVDTDHLFVLDDDGELAGVLSENDMLTAVTSLLTTESSVGDEDEPRASGLDEDDENVEEVADLSVQSVCEVCGTLKSDLANFNGQLVCSDCRSV